MKFVAIVLDALDVDNLFRLDMPFLQSLYEEKGEVLGCSTLPVTHSSNPMIWGGIEDNDLHWLKHENVEPPFNPAKFWEEEDGETAEGASFFTRQDYEESFIWDDLKAAGYDARALEIPIIIPPYSFNVEKSLEDCWFPANERQMYDHVRKLPELVEENVRDGADFIAVSIHVPDAWLHKIGEQKTTEEWVEKESKEMDKRLKSLVELLREKGYDYAIFGDHGSPQHGAMLDGDYVLTRHSKESIIVSNRDDIPTYTADLYQYFLDLFDAKEIDFEDIDISDQDRSFEEEDVKDRLENLGYS